MWQVLVSTDNGTFWVGITSPKNTHLLIFQLTEDQLLLVTATSSYGEH